MVKGKFQPAATVEELERQRVEAHDLMNKYIGKIATATNYQDRYRAEQYANIYRMLAEMTATAIRGRKIIDEVKLARQTSSPSGEATATSVAA